MAGIRVEDLEQNKVKKPQLKDITIHGKGVGSYNEWYVSLALDQLDLRYQYQVGVGTLAVKGYQIIDFVVDLAPKPQPINVHGEYWHRTKDASETVYLEQALNVRMRGTWEPLIILWENEVDTPKHALETVQKLFRI